jgi:hypothetical protein
VYLRIDFGSLNNAQKQSWIFIEFAKRTTFAGSGGVHLEKYVEKHPEESTES